MDIDELTAWSPHIKNYGDGKVLRCKYRNKHVAATPEEVVRQRVLYRIIDVAKWPRELIAVESTQHLASGRRRRPDILLFNKRREPCVVVECKRPEIPLDQSVFFQAEKYANAECAEEIWLTNGTSNLFYRRDKGDKWELLTSLDRLKIAGDVPPAPINLPNSNSRRSIENYWSEQAGLEHLAQKKYADECNFALAMHNVIYGMQEAKLPYSHKGVHLLEDRGIRPLHFSTPAGLWWGLYRNFLVATEGRVEAAAIGLQPWQTKTIDDVIICVGFVKEIRKHHALQLHSSNCTRDGKDWSVWHNAEMSRVPRTTVLSAVIEAGQTHLLGPQWEDERGKWLRRIRLGRLRSPATANWRNTREFIANLLHYSIIRTNLREAA